jgi:VWFA-related protein
MRRIPWPELPQRVADRLIPAAELGVAGCPNDLALRKPNRRVLQYIENVFYSWEEYDLTPVPGESFCIVMRRPENHPLTTEQSQVLLTASSLWLATAAEAAGLNPHSNEQLLGRSALSFAGDPAADLAPDSTPDRGVVGWIKPGGAPRGEPEGGPRAAPAGGLRVLSGGQVIGGTDERARVSDPRAFPYRAVSFVGYDTRSATGASLHGRATGFLVGPYMILTNGHVVWNGERRELVDNLTITPALSDGAAPPPFGSRNAVRLATNPGWVATGKIQYDYGAAFFDTPFSGISTYMPLAFDVSPAAGSTVRIAGYPATVRGAATQGQWSSADKVVSVQGRLLRYKVDTSPGNSGSPVWQVLGGGQIRAVAIHSTGDPTNSGNSGARLVSQNFDLLSEWLSWTPQTRNGLHLTINQVDPASCPLVKAIVTVNNNSGVPVPDLTRANFSLSENGLPQDIDVEQAQVSDSAISVALVLDASGSLSSSDVENIKSASRLFVDLLGPRDKVAVYHFANGVALAQDYTNDKNLAKAAINALNNNGGVVGDGNATALFDALVEAAQHSGAATGRRALVAMTDGQNNTGSNSLQDSVNAALAAGVPVFTIGFGSADTFVLNEIATATGGRFFSGASSADLQSILAAIGRSFQQQYLVSWVTNFISGGTQRIEVAVADSGERDQEATTYSQSGTSGCPQPTGTCAPRLVHPNGGEVWTKGKRQTIQWTTTGPSCGPTVGLAISDGNEVWYLLDTADDGSQPLNIDFLPTGSLYRAILADRATGNYHASDDTFTINAPSSGFQCTKGAETLCLLKGRYQVRVLWRSPQSPAGGFARAVPVGDAGGYFWFSESANAEIALKVVDSRSINAHVGVFSGALTDFSYSIFVTDSATGATRVYTNQQGEFRSFADDTAFGPPTEAADSSAAAESAAAESAAVRIDDGSRPSAQRAEEEKSSEVQFAASKAILWTQGDHPGSVGISSENRLETGGALYNTAAADDFVVPAQKAWVLQGVDVAGFYYGPGAHGPARSVNVVIYADRNGLPGATQCNFPQVRPRAGLSTGSFELDLSGTCRLTSGRYWVAVQANQDFPTGGQWAWVERTAQRERPSAWRNPGGGYNTVCNDWGRRAATCHVGDEPDLLFRLRGQETNSGGGGKCTSSSTALCLNNKRIKAEVTWRDSKGKLVSAKATSLTANTGYFSFGANALDLIVKIIDGRSVNGHFWVFYGGLSNAELTLKVTDPVTGVVKTYANAKGNYTSQADTLALPSP